jgi:Zn-dependent protease
VSASETSTQQAAKRRNQGMNGNLSIGRYGGVEVRLNWSLLAVVALIVWSLNDGVFPSQNPGLSHNTYLGMAVVASLLFLASIALHELGHSWVALREGIEVDSITLWLFGGVSQLKGRFASPGAEFRVAVSGPLVSIGLGVLFVLIAVAGLPSAVDGVAAWLGYINLILAAFNLLPASPLDGGRVLHSVLWRAKGDFAWATRVASEIGQGFGYLFIALGIAMFIFEGSFSGAWLAFIGWFLLQGARAEARYVATSWTTSPGRTGSPRIPSSRAADPSASSRSPRSPRFPAPTGIRDACETRCSRSTTSRCSPRTSWPWTPSRSCPRRRGIAGSCWTTDTWPGCCRSPTLHERSRSAEARPRDRPPGRLEHEMTSTSATETGRAETAVDRPTVARGGGK